MSVWVKHFDDDKFCTKMETFTMHHHKPSANQSKKFIFKKKRDKINKVIASIDEAH